MFGPTCGLYRASLVLALANPAHASGIRTCRRSDSIGLIKKPSNGGGLSIGFLLLMLRECERVSSSVARIRIEEHKSMSSRP
ncbi:hypothetical protein LMTR13_19150 [Bradyrhizobium icense]|uniref:Secreted protein n=1 Tax=Bradyrhizobium icense TaxID=1274631 RepID=A0A1B1UGT8_9BRAD|nr:hypothetical protein LMTR13_19150 [Bradyrhizobium icense]